MAQHNIYLDAPAVHAAAARLDTAADMIDTAVRTHLRRLAFDGAGAGRVHVAGGDALRHALDRWVVELVRWSRAGAEIASAMRVSAQNYTTAESQAAARVG